MACIDMDVIRELPGYKVILKAILKSQIQQLIDQLAACTDEESVILTASVSDGSLSHLGSESGKSFLQENDDVKSKFLGFCLRRFHVKAQQEREQPSRSYGLVHQSRQTHHHMGATRASGITRTFQRHQPYASNRKAFKSSVESPEAPLAIVANTAPKETKPLATCTSATEGAELDEDACTVSLNSDANDSNLPENDTQSKNTSKVDGHLVKEDNSAGEEVDNDDTVASISVKIEPGLDSKPDQGAVSDWDPEGSMDLTQYSAEASGSSPGQAMEDQMAHHNAASTNTDAASPTTDEVEFRILTGPLQSTGPRACKKHVCDVCSKSFTFATNLIRHRHLHSNQKTLSCHHCEYKCTRKDHMKMHIQAMHKDQGDSGDLPSDSRQEMQLSPQQ